VQVKDWILDQSSGRLEACATLSEDLCEGDYQNITVETGYTPPYTLGYEHFHPCIENATSAPTTAASWSCSTFPTEAHGETMAILAGGWAYYPQIGLRGGDREVHAREDFNVTAAQTYCRAQEWCVGFEYSDYVLFKDKDFMYAPFDSRPGDGYGLYMHCLDYGEHTSISIRSGTSFFAGISMLLLSLVHS
jgi:hypothetical protein